MNKTLQCYFSRLKVVTAIIAVTLSGYMQAQCPTVPNSTVTICDAAGYTFSNLNAQAVAGSGSIRWYRNPTGGSALPVNQLVRPGTYYAGDTTGNCGTRSPLQVIFTVPPSGQSLDGIFCSNDNATVQDYIDTAITPNVPAGGGVGVFTNFALTNPVNPATVLSGNSNYFIVFTDAGGCRSQIETGNTAVFASPAMPNPPLVQEFCSDANPTVVNLITGTTSNFTWYADVDNDGNPILPQLDNTMPLIDGETYYVFADNFICTSTFAAVVVNIEDPADAGTGTALSYCENESFSPMNLFDSLTGTPEMTGAWTGPLPISNGFQGTIDLTGTAPGTYTFTYTVMGNGVCADATANIVITIEELLTSGTASTMTAVFCESQASNAYDLTSLLDGEDPNGVWTLGTTSSGTVITSPFDLTTLTPGLYDFTYTQNGGLNPCPEEFTTVQVTIVMDPNAGNAVATEFCENDLVGNSPFDLFNSLDGSQDNNSGTWTDVSNATVNNPIDITSFTVAGSPYTFTYTIGNGTCTDSETISIVIQPAPESGAYVGTPFVVCEDQTAASSPYDLFNLLDGTQDTNGLWYAGTTPSGTPLANPIDLTTLGVGTFDFTYDVPAIGTCTDAPVTVQIIINPRPDTGVATPLTLCENELVANSPLDLFTRLTGNDAGGTWSDDDATGALTGSTVDLTGFAVGTFNFTYSITDANGCMNSTTVAITVQPAPESGAYVGTPFVVCEDQTAASSPYDLFNLLDGTQDTNGLWYAGTTPSGTPLANPIDLTTLGVGTFDFTYDVPAIGACTDAPVTVQIIINPRPDTGVATPLTLCENELVANSPLDLFTRLTGNDAGGSWSDDNATGALTGSTVDLTGFAVGTFNFTYSISNANGCINSTTVAITVAQSPDAGTASDIAYCMIDLDASSNLDLFTRLTGNDTGGVWSDDDTTGALNGSTVSLLGLPVGSYNFTYTVPVSFTCPGDMVTVILTINDIAAPTAPAIQDFCETGFVSDLAVLGNGVIWYADAQRTQVLAVNTPLVDGANYYASQVDPATNCESASTTLVTVNLNDAANAGIAVPLNVCNDNNAVNLFTGLDGSQDAGGTWTELDTSGALSGSTVDATSLSPGNYRFQYTVLGTAPCPDASVIVTVNVSMMTVAGSNALLNVCSDDSPIDLFTLLGTADTGGIWSPALTSGSGVYDPAVDPAVVYTYTVSNTCNTASAQVTVNRTAAPDAGEDTTITICVIDGSFDLVARLNGTPDSTGTWSPLLTSGTNIFDPSLDTAPSYVYTVTAQSPCTTDATATITIQINDSPAPVLVSATLDFCATENAIVIDLDSAVQGTNILWYDSAIAMTPLAANLALQNGRTYYATQTDGTTCESSQRVAVTVTINDESTPVFLDGANLLCINDNPTIDTLSEAIIPPANTALVIRWYDAATAGNLLSASTLLTQGATYYAVFFNATTGCESSTRLAVTVDLTGCPAIQVPDGFSPNGDGLNDTFDVDNLAFLYPNFEMEIFNRYGNVVYKGTAATPRFNGQSNQSGTLGSGELPVGVYFYILKLNDNVNKPVQGRLYLSR